MSSLNHSHENGTKVLTPDEIKVLAADKHRRKILEGRLDTQALAEILCDEELRSQSGDAVILRLCKLLSTGNDYTTFSSLKPADEDRLVLLDKGSLNIGSEFQHTPLSEHTKAIVTTLYTHWSLATEHGCRTLIDLFMLDAVQKSNSLVGIFPEFQIEGIVGDFKIGGALDYLVTSVDIPIDDRRRFRALRRGRAKPPFLVVIEAKKFETLEDGVTQLLGEMKVLWVNAPDDAKQEIFGVLTNGVSWIFYLLDKYGLEYYSAAKSDRAGYDFEEDEGLIVNFLHHFMLRQLPPGVTHD